MNLFENLQMLKENISVESNKSIDELIDIAGGINYIDELFHNVVNNYDGIENDIDEVAEFTYDDIKGNLSMNEWISVLEYLYYNSSNLSESMRNHELWAKFIHVYNGFVPIGDLSNYFSLSDFGKFTQWCRKEANLDYDDDKRYDNWDEVFKDLDEATGAAESISLENIFNFFTTDDLNEFWDWVVREYDLDYEEDLEESTSGIGGAYTTKAIDMIPAKIKKVEESLYDEYLERVMDEKSNVELVNLLHEIRDNKELSKEDIKKLEDEIKTKVKTIKTEAITKFYGKEWSDEEIQKMIDIVKENPGIEFVADPNEIAHPLNYNGKDYWLIGEEKQLVFDGKDCVVILTVDDDLNRYLTYFEYQLVDDGDGESGPQELKMDVSEVPYKMVEV